MKKIFLGFVMLLAMSFSISSCSKDNAFSCVNKAAEYAEASLDFLDSPSVATCNALKKAAQAYLKSCKKYMDADEIEDISNEIDELSCVD